MKKINLDSKLLFKSSLTLLGLFIFYLNVSLFYSPDFQKCDTTHAVYNEDVYYQLQHLKTQLHNGAGRDMQNLYPEGFVFLNVLYGLTWADFISSIPHASPLFLEGIHEVSWALEEVSSPYAKSIFDENLLLQYGAFYRGWTNYLLGKKIELQLEAYRDSIEISIFKSNCQEISNVLQKIKSPFLETYSNQKWPADGIIAVSSLSLHDHVFNDNTYDQQLSGWLTKVQLNFDPKTGLIPHYINGRNDEIIEGARGSSQSLLLLFLNEIDTSFAQEQFLKYKLQFLDSRLGLPGIREYPLNQVGRSDIDSGPVIWGIGGASSIVGQRTMGTFKHWNEYVGLRNCIESFGMGIKSGSKKKYLFGHLPIADAFIAWSNVVENRECILIKSNTWRLKFQLLSLILIVILITLFFKF
ncbi:MAG: hypothetical protein HKN51_03740 [Saprospiraceae bacterium]|nr:hypothetical protein [Saprospiraceae bacterium]